ncbi:hypothetical protein CJU13_16925 [Pseudomonas aeruginosa]|nr:hypothetical protein ATC05_15725 [Pseudomonas aeruginosa]KSC27689.1 hypothetical protein AO889_15480 [Pseudomonas aeruginosa]KSD06915.1 hypothetical protein AO890_04480 [Pseudomonas aeruginosa]OFK12108.1 hypothetical protein HMPREF2830_29300 [Pseudomonas aeruginosa]OWJ01719.1 hypothetical protein CDC09_08815 [Pseudomonas aeruginosa]
MAMKSYLPKRKCICKTLVKKRFMSLLTKPDLSSCYHTNAGLYVTVDYEFISTQILNGVALT